MRITCPNCSAQYEIDDALIPETGRDVQCSNCGKGWFQKPLDVEAEAEEPEVDEDEHLADAPDEAEEPDETDDDIETEVEDEPTAAPSAPAPVEAERRRPLIEMPPPPLLDEDEMEAPSRPSAPMPRPRTELIDEDAPEEARVPTPRRPDPEALSILREEAEFEAERRRNEAAEPLETQPDLGLAGAAPVAKAAAAISETAKRGELLPDIDKINSTLRSDADREEELGASPGSEVRARRRGFRSGFLLMVLIAGVLLLLYLYAPIIARAVPALEGPLTAYVNLANGFRDMVNGLLGRGVDSLR